MVSPHEVDLNPTVSAIASPVLEASYHRWLEKDIVPDWVIRAAIRRLLRERLRKESRGGWRAVAERTAQLLDQLRSSPIALSTDLANAQHYEVPSDFFKLALGPNLKYSCALWNPGTRDLGTAERDMLALTCERAELANGQEILELGCGWGSVSLYMAERYPGSRILAVSNSRTQKAFIDAEASRRGLRNLEVVTCDMNQFDTLRTFDRVVSVEMFEHMRNYRELLGRIAAWTRPDALLFVHIFTHKTLAYPFEVEGPSDWMAQHFFTGGLMPSEGLLHNFDDDFRVIKQWKVNGAHYQKTCEAWLKNTDQHRKEVLRLFSEVYGASEALRWLVRWRVFFMACSELFGFQGGEEWAVSHYLLRK
jgi:cyclopropane-fatty-acyl-phospholipid synthase